MPAAAPVKAFGTQMDVTAAPARKQIAENAISTTLNVAVQDRAVRRAVPRRYRWMRITGIRAISTSGNRSTRSSSGIPDVNHPSAVTGFAVSAVRRAVAAVSLQTWRRRTAGGTDRAA